MKLTGQDIVMLSLNPKAEDAKTAAIKAVLQRYEDPKRKWYNIKYLHFGLKEHFRLTGVYPVKNAMVAWLFHAFEPGNEESGAVAALAHCRTLGFSLEDAEKYICPLIVSSHPSLESSSVVGDMRLTILGQSRIHYLSDARKVKAMWKSSGIDEDTWRLGRIAVLNAILGRKRIYFRDEFEKALATLAKENMQAELALLGYAPLPSPSLKPTPMPADRIIVLNPDIAPIKLGDLMAKTKAAQASKEGEKPNEAPPQKTSPPPVSEEPRTPKPPSCDYGED
jgi:predicted metal-dependent HD superfamily phosphohydrolase